jgi:hypothetical protein
VRSVERRFYAICTALLARCRYSQSPDVAWLYRAQRFAITFFSILLVTLALMLGAALLFRKAPSG